MATYAPPRLYYEDDTVAIYHGDCKDILPMIDAELASVGVGSLILTDPPYGVAYSTNAQRDAVNGTRRSIAGDEDSGLRDWVVGFAAERGLPVIAFGSWKVSPPEGTKAMLVWDTLGALGMGDLSIPWKPSHQQIYVIGNGGHFQGKRGSDVLRHAPVQATGRRHPHEKPEGLLRQIIRKTVASVIYDPFMGSGTTLVAAKLEGRKAVGIELDERYCEIAANRCRQKVLF